MKSSRRTMEDLDVSRNKIARRWGSGGYGSQFPEEPITNYLDVSEKWEETIKIQNSHLFYHLDIRKTIYNFPILGTILRTNRDRYSSTNIQCDIRYWIK